MSADNYYLIDAARGGFVVTMGFASNEEDPRIDKSSVWFPTLAKAVVYADHQPAEYGWRCTDEVQPLLNAMDAAWGKRPRKLPRIVCLCGSTRFYDVFQAANYRETMAGRIVLSVGFYPHSSEQAHGQAIGCDDEQKRSLDQLHLRKIDLADEVLVLNVGGYVGDSTRREIEYAGATGKPIRWLEPVRGPSTLEAR